jgi:hypothetical protein
MRVSILESPGPAIRCTPAQGTRNRPHRGAAAIGADKMDYTIKNGIFQGSY